jgi:hypothetical protein
MDKSTIIRSMRTAIRELDQILAGWNDSDSQSNMLKNKSLHFFEMQIILRNFNEIKPEQEEFPPLDSTETEIIPTPVTGTIHKEVIQENSHAMPPEKKAAAPSEEISISADSTKKEDTPIEQKGKPEFVPGVPPPANRSFNDASDPAPSLFDKLRDSKVTDLKKAIPLHEKFLYISEFFQGDNVPYNEFIDAINLCSTLENAMELLASESQKSQWNTESHAFQKFSATIQRKFSGI